MNKSTTEIMRNLLQTLDGVEFIKEVQKFDNVTQRQCFLKAQKELLKNGVVRLHGRERVMKAVKSIRAVLEKGVTTV
jgi:hypothetical protein